MDYAAALDSMKEDGEILGEVAGGATRAATTGENFFQAMRNVQGLKQDPMFLEKADAMKSVAALKNAQTRDQLVGMKEFPEWMQKTGGDPDKVLTTPWNGTSLSGTEQYKNALNAAWMRKNQERALDIKKQGVDNNLTAAELKNQTAQDRIAVQQNNAAANIKSRETIAALKNPASDPDATPNTMDLPNGHTAVWMRGGKTIHIIKPDGTGQNMTIEALRKSGKNLSENGQTDAEKAHGTNILNWIDTKAYNQIQPAATPAPATNGNNDPLGLFQ